MGSNVERDKVEEEDMGIRGTRPKDVGYEDDDRSKHE